MFIRKLITLLIFLLQISQLAGQPVRLDAQQQSLREVLNELSESHNLQFSASEAVLANCTVTLSGTFPNTTSALQQLLEPCQLSYRKTGNVFTLHPKPQEALNQLPSAYYVRVQVLDAATGAPLPYAIVKLDQQCFLTGLNGEFEQQSYHANASMSIHHLAFEKMDTLLQAGQKHVLKLIPRDICVEPVAIHSDFQNHAYEFGDEPEIVKAWRSGNLKPGIYRNFKEFLDNAPSGAWNPDTSFIWEERTGMWALGNRIWFKRVRLNKQLARQMGRLIGFCDGDSIYFHRGISIKNIKIYRNKDRTRRMRRSMDFAPVYFLGQHAFYEISLYSFSTRGLWSSNRERRFLNLITGDQINLNRIKLKKLLTDDPELLSKYKADKNKLINFRSYLIEYYARKE